MGVLIDLHDGRGDILGCGGIAGAVVGAEQIVVDGLGHAHHAAVVAHGLHILVDLVAGIHGVVTAVIKEIADIVLLEHLQDTLVVRVIQLGIGNLVPAGAQSRGGGVLQQPQLLRVLLPHVKQPVGQHALDAVLRAQYLGDGAGLQRRVDDAVGAGIDDRRGTAGLADDTRAAQFFHRSIPPKHRLRFDDAPAHACDAPPVCPQTGILPWKFGNVNAFALANMKKYDTIGM